jgi:two-component system response regulator YesN
MNRAAMLLSTTSWSVTEISDNLAFLSPAYFVHRFKLHFGTTPSAYRKTHMGLESQAQNE